MVRRGALFIVSAPSGAGKTSLVSAVVERCVGLYDIARAVTYTTKQPRPGEMDGKDYHFISSDEFEKKIKENFFIEYSTVYGYYYGTPRSYIEDLSSGRSWILIIDRAGAQQIIDKVRDAILIWIAAPNIHTLKSRLEARGTETQEHIEKRLKLAANEIHDEQEKTVYKYHIINTVFEAAVEQLQCIVTKELGNPSSSLVTKKIKTQRYKV